MNNLLNISILADLFVYHVGEGTCVEGEVRLLDGTSSTNGRVEVCVEGRWLSVCDNGWTNEDAEVVCTQMGLAKVGEFDGRLCVVL